MSSARRAARSWRQMGIRLSPIAAAIAVLVLVAVPASARHHRAPAARRHHRAQVLAGLAQPALGGPANDASLPSLPTFVWAPVAHAASYQFELAAYPRFASLVQRAFSGQGSFQTHNTAATLDKAVPDGAYYWRVRALTLKGGAGPWSATRRLVKAWSSPPQLQGPNGTTVSWPAQPLVFSWSTVPYATRYQLTVATDPALANQVIGSGTRPLDTQGTVYTPSAPLAAGAYFWAVTPLDAEGHRGTRSQIASFTYGWPTATSTKVDDLNPDARVFDPLFSWAPVAGAARYEVEVNAAEDFPTGSKWCCSEATIGTSLAPTRVLANNSYYWRVRAIDPRGNAGAWNQGLRFTKAFDDTTPTIPNLTVRDVHGSPLANDPETDTPIVTWDPVPGASRYQVQVVPYQNSLGCDWSQVAQHSGSYQADTATTAWTPLGPATHIGPTAWPYPQTTFQPLAAAGARYCLRVLARSDDDAQGGQVISDWTQLNGAGKPAFTYLSPPPPGAPAGEFVTPASAYVQPAPASVTPRTPLFAWERVAGAQGYFVVIARDAGFTQIADVGYTNVPAYAPRLANAAPLSDETTAYYWAVLPATGSNGSGVFHDVPQDNNPQAFNESSVPPTALTPTGGTVVSTQPTFEWTAAENARNYRLQVASDPSFGNPIEDVTTDASAFTSSSTYPADTVLYWRVRANDWTGQGLNWSATQTFVRTLPAPVPSPRNATGGEPIPVLNWSLVQGAIGYEIHVERIDGSPLNFGFPAAAFTPIEWYGVGVWRWQVRADFPTKSAGTVTSGYSPPVQFVRTLEPPSGAAGVKSASRLAISWNPDPAAKQYEVDVSTTDGFLTMVDSHRTENTSWAPSIDLKAPANQGRLFWRVAAIDQGGNVGAFATGSFGKPPAKPPCKRAVPKLRGRRVAGRRCAVAKKHKRRGH